MAKNRTEAQAEEEAGLTREIADTLDSINRKLAVLIKEHREQGSEIQKWLSTLHDVLSETSGPVAPPDRRRMTQRRGD